MAATEPLVFDAIRTDTFWIITHPEFLPAVVERTERIQAAVPPE